MRAHGLFAMRGDWNFHFATRFDLSKYPDAMEAIVVATCIVDICHCSSDSDVRDLDARPDGSFMERSYDSQFEHII